MGGLYELPVRVEVYLEYDELPDPCRPAMAVRHDGATLVTIDPRTPAVVACKWLIYNLTIDESNTIRAAHGVGQVGTPAPEGWVSDMPCGYAYVPRALRLHEAAKPRAGEVAS